MPGRPTTSAVCLHRPVSRANLPNADDAAGCGNVINPSNSVTAGILSPLGDASCQTLCRGSTTNEACGFTETFISIYEYTVSGFLTSTCVPLLLLPGVLYVKSVSGGGGERFIERSAEEGTGGDQIELAVRKRETKGAVLEGPSCWDTGNPNPQSCPRSRFATRTISHAAQGSLYDHSAVCKYLS